MAGFTAVQGPASGEKSHKEIFEGVYGGTFIGSGTNLGYGNYSIFSNGTITATRVDDNGLAGLLNMLTGAPGTGDDDIWTDGMATTTAEARFAGYTQEVGYRVTSLAYVKLFDVTGTGFAVTGSATVTFGTGATWEWARADDSDSGPLNNPHYSDEPSNSDGLDHMVTYAITGIPALPVTTKVWLVFFEDVSGGGSDRDFNDLAVEIRAVECVTDADCFSNGLFCDGNEVCVDGVCLSAGDPCSPPSPVCCEDINQCKAECCSDADCPSNGVFCDGVEVCVDGTCVSPGSPCSGGAPVCCEETDICKAECCSDADCQAPNPPCEGGEACNLSTGLCEAQPDAQVSTMCEADGNLCTVDHCDGMGQCVFLSNVICQSPNPPCEGGEVCDQGTGLCVAQPDAVLSTPCEADGDLCTIDHCNGSGSCVQLSTVVCLPSVGACDAGAHCVTSTGFCEDYPDPPFSTPCNTDNNLCTIEHCDGTGFCVPLGNVTCQPANPPCEGGETCDPATGFCVADLDAALSTPCEVESPPNHCTIDHCNGMGACVLLGNVMCQSPDPPCEGGQHCEPASGDCIDDPDAQLSTPCEAEAPPNLCTIDHCDGLGACVFLSSVPCQPANPPCEGGEVCNPSTGLCVAQPDAVLSTPCEAESPPNFCTNDHCDGSGLCVHLSDVVCPGPVPPCEGGQECVPASGECRNLDDAVLSTPCQTDADPCTIEHCDGRGLCVLLNDLCGACCDRAAAGGVCTEHVLPADCVGDQLVFYLNETCAAVESSGRCGEHRGACCDTSPGAGGLDPAGACIDDVLPGDCVGPQRVWTKDTLCADANCEETPGACCNLLTGVCTDPVFFGDCQGDQQAWTKGVTCADVTCDARPGACCDHDTFGGCSVTTQAECGCEKCEWFKLMTCEQIECVHNAIPTVSQWGLAILTLLLLTGAKIYFGRRQADAA
ncbi:MAG: DUF4114 domain-containing protein [Planctomycetota bacterium]